MTIPTPDPWSSGDRRQRARDGLRQIAVGAGLLVLGLAITVGTFAAARPGGSYTLAYGPMVFGLVELVRGLIGWWPNREAAIPASPARRAAPSLPVRTPSRDEALRPAPPRPTAAPGPRVGAVPPSPPRVNATFASSAPPATANDAERRRLSLSATEVKTAERPAAPWHRPTIGGRRETDPITLLRFSAFRCEIGADGLRASYRDGTTRDVAWSEIVDIAVRQLPPDPPWDRTLVVDLSTASGSPLRILSTTFVNFAALPGGATATRLDNVRGLARLVQERNPSATIEAGTEPVLLSGALPLRLLSMNQFAEYDSRHG